jgi:hypothetical protein
VKILKKKPASVTNVTYAGRFCERKCLEREKKQTSKGEFYG